MQAFALEVLLLLGQGISCMLAACIFHSGVCVVYMHRQYGPSAGVAQAPSCVVCLVELGLWLVLYILLLVPGLIIHVITVPAVSCVCEHLTAVVCQLCFVQGLYSCGLVNLHLMTPAYCYSACYIRPLCSRVHVIAGHSCCRGCGIYTCTCIGVVPITLQ